MADIFNDFMNWLSNGEILGMLVMWVFIGIGTIVFIVWLILTREQKAKEYKPLDMAKQVKKDLDFLYNIFSIDSNRTIYQGMQNIGFVKGYIPIVWNKSISIDDNIRELMAKVKKDRADKRHDDSLKDTIRNYRKSIVSNGNTETIQEIQDIVSGENPYVEAELEQDIIKGKRKGKTIVLPVNMKCLRVCKNNSISKIFSSIGLGVKYMIVDDAMLTISDHGYVLNPMVQPSMFYNIMFFSTTARIFIEDIGFRINRQNEIQELANIIPREMFFSNELAKKVASWREQADIEREKFRGQKEGAED